MIELNLRTTAREIMVDITPQIQKSVEDASWKNGMLMIFCPHTTCALTINEGADPDVRRDMTRFFAEMIPFRHGWSHTEGNSDAHIKSSLLGASVWVPVEAGRICLGTWQCIYLYEGDGPRMRSVWLQWLPIDSPS